MMGIAASTVDNRSMMAFIWQPYEAQDEWVRVMMAANQRRRK